MTMPDDRRFDPATDDDLLADATRTDTDPANAEGMDTNRADTNRASTDRADADRIDTAGTDARATHPTTDPGLSGPTADADISRAATDADVGRPATDAVAGRPAAGNGTGPDPLVASDAAVDLRARWDVIQQGFVDDPRNAVSEADHLVDDLLTQLSETFIRQHQELEQQWSDGEPSTEDLRTALQRYRAFFQRLLTI